MTNLHETPQPIACNLLLAHMIVNNVQFTFLRRSFYQAKHRYSLNEIVDSINGEIRVINKMELPQMNTRLNVLENMINAFSPNGNILHS